MNNYPQLDAMISDMQKQSPFYLPTAFWEEASARIAEDFRASGIENFRNLLTPLWFFVPTFGVPGNSFTTEQSAALRELLKAHSPNSKKAHIGLQQFLEGRGQALADYRVLLAADRESNGLDLAKFSESTAGKPVEQFCFDGRNFSRSSLNYLLGLAFLKAHLPADETISTVLEIGGGFGTLGEILISMGRPELRYIDVDIPPTAFAAEYYLSEAVGAGRVATYASTKAQKEIAIDQLPPASVLCAWQIEHLRGKIDLFVNFISFQEMEPHIVKNYLDQVNRLETRWVLLRNMREGKQRRSDKHTAGVETPILGDDYAAMLPNYKLVARNVHPFGFETVDGFNSELFLLRRTT